MISCTGEEEHFNPEAALTLKTWESYKVIFEGMEYDALMFLDYYLEDDAETGILMGDCTKVIISFRLEFKEDHQLDFYRIRERYIKCSGCDSYLLDDKSEFVTYMTFSAKEKFIILSNEEGWDPYYYETLFLSDNRIRINQCQAIGDWFNNRVRTFHSIPLQEGETYYVDIFLEALKDDQ